MSFLKYFSPSSVTTSSSNVNGVPEHILIKHSPWVVPYRGADTTIALSLLSNSKKQIENPKVFLQCRGYFTGLFGWGMGSWLIGSQKDHFVEVSPTQKVEDWNKLPASVKKKAEKDILAYSPYSKSKESPVTTTMVIRIPIDVQDGYYRLIVKNGASSKSSKAHSIANTETFRIASLTLPYIASPSGAPLPLLIPELVLGTISLAVYTAGCAAFFSVFPIFKLIDMCTYIFGNEDGNRKGKKGSWKAWAVRKLYTAIGADQHLSRVRTQVEDKYRVTERVSGAKQTILDTIPFAAAGVRTDRDKERNASTEPQEGIWAVRSS